MGKNNLKFKNCDIALDLLNITKIRTGRYKLLSNLKRILALGTKFNLFPFSYDIKKIEEVRIKTPDITIPLL